MNILQVQDRLKGFSEQQLAQEMQMPSGMAPQFLVLSELQRRKRVRDEFQAQQNAPQSTVAQDAVAAAGMPQAPLQQMAQALAPKTDVAQNTGIMSIAPQASAQPEEAPVQRMYGGGQVKKMREGTKVVVAGKVLTEQADGTYRDEQGRVVRTALEDLIAIPSDLATALTPEPSVPIDDGRTWGQRNIGDPLRSLFRPVGEAGRAIGAPVGDALRGVGEPVGDVGRAAGAYVMENAPRFVLGPIPAEAASAPVRNVLDRRAQFEPEMTPTAPTYDQLVANARKGVKPTADQLVAAANAGNLTTQQAVDVQAMIESDYVPTTTEQGVASLPGVTPTVPYVTDPTTPYARGTAALGDFLAGTFGGRTLGEQAEIDRQRAEQEAAFRRQEGEPAVVAQPATEDTPRPRARPDQEVIDLQNEDAGGGGGGGGGGGAGAGAAPMSSYEQELASALGRIEKRANQDRWLALAQAGMALMSSKEPTLMGALGEAGIAGLGQYQQTRDAAEKERMAILSAQYQMDMDRQKLALARAGGGGGGLTAYQMYQMDRNAQSDALEQAQALQEYAAGLDPNSAEYLDIQARLAAFYSGGGAGPVTIRTPSAG
jgi:hypothetical protein